MDREYTVTIPLEDYKELIMAQTNLDNLIDFIFNNCEYCSLLNKLDFDKEKLNVYLKSVWNYSYQKNIERLKNKK